jgi:hypothetical protein
VNKSSITQGSRDSWRRLSNAPYIPSAKARGFTAHSVRRNMRGQDRYYAQLVCEGVPYVKRNENGERTHPIGKETVGLDIGSSTIAIVGNTQATLTQFADEVVRDHLTYLRINYLVCSLRKL